MHEKGAPRGVFRFGPFTLDPRSGELRKGPTRVRVPDQSIAILKELVRSPGELVTREALRERLWPPDTHVDFEAGLNAAVRRLREVLNDSADTPQYVETLPRRGYRFIAPVEGTFSGADHSPAEPAPVEAPIAATGAITSAAPTRFRQAVLVGLGLTAIALALWVGLTWRDAAPAPKPVPVTRFPGLELDPAISPDGRLIAFAWEGASGDNFDIYVRSIDGSSQLRLTTDAAPDHAPAWSPDGQRLAFVRVLEGQRQIVVLPALGGSERRLFEASAERGGWMLGAASYGLSWTPDGSHLVYGDRSDSPSSSAIYLYSLVDGDRRQLTRPPANLSDIHPVISPNGQYLGFVRTNPLARGGSVFLQTLEQLQVVGEPTQLTSGRPVNGFDWARDSRSVIHDAGPVEPGLWRAMVAGGAPTLVLSNIAAFNPSVARSGAAVVYQNMSIDPNIWELPTPSSPSPQPTGDATFRVVASTSPDLDMQFSPDGTRIAFTSHRSGQSEVWVSSRDGSQAKQLTNFAGGGRVGSPSWSADGKWIAFDAIQTATGNWNLLIVSVEGGPLKPLISDASNNVRPSWSLDGQWIYFGSDRTGDWQIWRVPSAGGDPVRITREGGVEPVVSWDGRRVYYAKPPPVLGIWEVPTEGGDEMQVVSRGRALNFDVAENGIFLMDTSTMPQATVEMFSFSSRLLTTVARLPPGARSPSYLRVSRDGKSMLYTQFDQWHSDVEMLPATR
jgi:Tol biopolymer transport system component/DNA-binding winged helix-turn-helix (wHTH) protein